MTLAISAGIGLSSGLDYSSLITNLLLLERQPVTNLQSRQNKYKEKISIYNDLSSKLSAFKTAAQALKTTTDFLSKKISSSDVSVVDATATNTALAAGYTISDISQIARAHQFTHNTGLADADSTVVLSAGGRFQFTINGETQTIDASSDMTLRQLADAINEKTYTGSIKAQASVINTGTSASPSYKLVLASTATGADYGMMINADDSTLDLDQVQGADSDSDGQYRVDMQAAQNALFKVNGLQVTKSSNTVSDVITGVTFTIKQQGTVQVNLTVENDSEAIRKKIEDFVTAYNDVVNLVSSKSTYDTTAKKGGPLNAEATAKSIVNKLRSMLITPVSGLGSGIDSLAEIGITTNSKDGTLVVNTATLSGKLSTNLEEVADIFTSSGSGIAGKIADYVTEITGSSGALTGRTKGLQSVIDDISSDIRRIESRLAYKEQALRRQYAALESLLSGFSAQGSFLSGQMSSWS